MSQVGAFGNLQQISQPHEDSEADCLGFMFHMFETSTCRMIQVASHCQAENVSDMKLALWIKLQ